MNADYQIEKILNQREKRRERSNNNAFDRLDRQYAEAEKFIGILIRDGKSICYINQLSATGKMTGKIKQFPDKSDAVCFLIRNNYI